jgi:mannose-6-phosphate isomerase-like protein (cupin superfamily)
MLMADIDTEPVVVRYADLERRTWGDEESGRLPDWFYADNVHMQLNIVGMAPNGAVLHSDQNRSIFGSDELFYVLEGTMVQANPETGEVLVIRPGEAAFFRKDTWHHQFNYSNHQLRMLEFFQPSSKTGTGGRYARTKQNIVPPYKHGRDEFLGRWPMARAEAQQQQTMWAIRDSDVLWRLEGATRGRELLVGILASTEHMTVGKIEFLSGQRSDNFVHEGDKVIFLEEGNLHIEFPDTGRWVELDAWDGCRIPEGTRHSFYNMSHLSARCVFSVAPDYRPGCAV